MSSKDTMRNRKARNKVIQKEEFPHRNWRFRNEDWRRECSLSEQKLQRRSLIREEKFLPRNRSLGVEASSENMKTKYIFINFRIYVSIRIELYSKIAVWNWSK